MKNRNVVCFGEVLWDNLPSGRVPGGAPLNVAYHLHKKNVNSIIISSVGSDRDGEELLAEIRELGLSSNFCKINSNYPTSTVEVVLSDNGEVDYEIVAPVAWDEIIWDDRFIQLIGQSEAFVFGSLSGRNTVSRETLSKLLDSATYRVFDVNLREPFFRKEYIFELLNKTDLLKLNMAELYLLLEWMGYKDLRYGEGVEKLLKNFPVQEILLTNGDLGAYYFSENQRYECSAITVKVQDTVGSGDALLAAFLSNRLNGETIKTSLDYSVLFSAFITTKKGSCPEYTDADIISFKEEI